MARRATIAVASGEEEKEEEEGEEEKDVPSGYAGAPVNLQRTFGKRRERSASMG
jgi:hypothetical protein